METAKVSSKDLPGELGHHIPKRKRGSTPEWKPSKEKLWEDLAKSSRQFKQAYNLMMALLQNLQDLPDPKEPERKKMK